jgi:hypothetical protein
MRSPRSSEAKGSGDDWARARQIWWPEGRIRRQRSDKGTTRVAAWKKQGTHDEAIARDEGAAALEL